MKTSIRKVLGANVKYYRFLIGFSQEKLAENCDLSSRYISDIENAKCNISMDTLEKISSALNVEAYLLLVKQKQQSLPKRVNMK